MLENKEVRYSNLKSKSELFVNPFANGCMGRIDEFVSEVSRNRDIIVVDIKMIPITDRAISVSVIYKDKILTQTQR